MQLSFLLLFSIIFQAVVQIGLIIYTTLDFGLGEDEERQLSPQMERLLDLMTSAGKGSSINDVTHCI
jgi:hypothetical protein